MGGIGEGTGRRMGIAHPLPILLQYFAKTCPVQGLPLCCQLGLDPESEITKRE